MLFSPLDSSLWCCEFILELAGAILVFKNLRSIKILWAYLAFRAGADLFSFALACGWGAGHYGWANYGQRLIGYVLLACLAVRVVGIAFNADARKVRNYGLLAGGLSVLAIAFAHAGPWKIQSLYAIGFRADMLLCATIALGMMMRDLEIIVLPLEGHWKTICYALIIAVFSHGLSSELRMHGYIGIPAQSHLMALGQIAALSFWIWAAWSKPEEMPVIRLDSIGSPNAEPLILDEVLESRVM